MELASFLPYYPFIGSQNQDVPPFEEQIFRKKEFYEGRTTNPENQRTTGLTEHQEMIRRYISPYTQYDELLLYHQMGTGKTVAAIGVAEFLLEKGNISRVVILVKSQTLVDNFIYHISSVVAPSKYYPEVDTSGMRPENAERMIQYQLRKNIRKHYYITTYETFFNSQSSDSFEPWQNALFIVDEVHNLLGQDKLYEFYDSLFHAPINRRILLLTGTPMRNDVADFGKIMNLLLPLSDRFSDSFTEQYLQGMYIQNIEEFKSKIQGRVSYLQSFEKTVDHRYRGRRIGEMRYFNLVPSVMSSFQATVYTETDEKTEGGLRRPLQQAGLFVFPNGTIGNEGFQTYFRWKNKRYIARGIWNSTFFRKTREEKLELVRKYSSKYAAIIDRILRHPRKKMFIYNESIQEGGSIVFSECLKLFDYEMVHSMKLPTLSKDREQGLEEKIANGEPYDTPLEASSQQPRFALLSETVLNTRQFRRVLSTFNDIRNYDGRFIQVIIGGQQISEGLSFKDVREVHVALPHWNFSVTEQAIARTMRYKSHRNKLDTVSIFLHAAVMETTDQTLDVYMYQTAEIKDIRIKRLERVIQESSFDCAIHYDRNQNEEEKDGSRACHYQSCEYRCDGVEYPYERNSMELDYTTWNAYYAPQTDARTRPLYQQLQTMLQTYASFSLSDFLSFSNLTTNRHQLYHDLRILIERHIPFVNALGKTVYLQQEKDQMFWSANAWFEQPLSNVTYVTHPVLQPEHNGTMSMLLKNTEMDTDIAMAKQIKTLSISERLERIQSLDQHVQSIYVEQAYRLQPYSVIAKQLVERFTSFLYPMGDRVYSTMLLQEENRLRVWENEEWKDAPASNLNLILDAYALTTNEYGMYMRVMVRRNQKNIVNVRQGTEYGTNCDTLRVQDIQTIMEKTIGERNETLRRRELCERLYAWFMEKRLVLYL